jgi:3D (Asp-Asp-Asp) domain-containing protein
MFPFGSRFMSRYIIIGACGLLLVMLAGCMMRDARWGRIRPPGDVAAREYRLEITGYCECGACCGWKRNWFGRPVIASGPDKGKPKRVGITASGEKARRGTIAADTSIFPFGTVMYVPGYGYGVVEDRGGAIKGYKIDLYFSSHRQALEWGRQRKVVKVWPPSRR